MIKNFVFTIFGASGDLAQLKIFPSLFEIALAGKLPTNYIIIGFARSDFSHDAFRDLFRLSIENYYGEDFSSKHNDILKLLLRSTYYFKGVYDEPASYNDYVKFRDSIRVEGVFQEVFYFSIPPQIYESVVKMVSYISQEDSHEVKLVLEKPFGVDETSATHLFHVIGERFHEDQVYLIDHYLGKKSVRSILSMRHNNRVLNLILRGQEIDNIQISAMEPFGVENRLGYFDKVGTFRDMLQSHLLQVLALITMSIPISRDAYSFRQEKEAILSTLYFQPEADNVCLGQYEGYCAEDPDKCNLSTATFGAVKAFINRDTWHKTPLLMRSGKFIGESKKTYITIELKKFNFQSDDIPANKIVFELSPHEKIHIKLVNESFGTSRITEMVNSDDLGYASESGLGDHGLLLYEAFQGNQMFFLSFNEIIASWRFMDRVIDFVQEKLPERYAQHSDGPTGQHNLVAPYNIDWYDL